MTGSATMLLGAVPPLRSYWLSWPPLAGAANLFKALYPEPSLREVPTGPLSPSALPASLLPKDAALQTGTAAAGTWPWPQPQQVLGWASAKPELPAVPKVPPSCSRLPRT